MTPLLWVPIAVLVAGIACIPLKQISVASLDQARDYALLSLVGVATIWLAYAAPVFAPIGLWTLVHWRDRHTLETVASWAWIIGFWFAAQALPPVAWPWIRAAWCVTGTVAAAHLTWSWYTVGRDPVLNPGRPWWHPLRPLHSGGWFGQRTLAAAFFALVLPFYPWWALPVPLLGLWVTSSWAAWAGSLGAAIVLWPGPGLGALGVSMLLGACTAPTRRLFGRWRWLEFTPRGDSLDSVYQRARIARLMLKALLRPAWFPWGYGSRTGARNMMETAVMRWAGVHGVERIPTGHPHLDAAHYLMEYGLPGVATLVILAALVIPKLQWGDPYSACVIAGAILSLGTLPFRTPSTGLLWLAAVVHLVSR